VADEVGERAVGGAGGDLAHVDEFGCRPDHERRPAEILGGVGGERPGGRAGAVHDDAVVLGGHGQCLREVEEPQHAGQAGASGVRFREIGQLEPGDAGFEQGGIDREGGEVTAGLELKRLVRVTAAVVADQAAHGGHLFALE
jgi:hypothetical protein